VKLPDVNLLLYALHEASPRHRRARPGLEEILSGSEPIGFAWTVLLAILRGLVGPLGTAGNLATDAHLAALAIE
jgi:predicted nucleic acid-binding protein